jgi:CO/xanthine dehydrogenase Mo-binding subunit
VSASRELAAELPEVTIVSAPPGVVSGTDAVGLVGVPAAIANAVFQATGKRVRDLPITPDKLLQGAGPRIVR